MSDTGSRRAIIGHALRPLVQHLAPASRLITPSTNKLITSLHLSRCTQPRFILDFRSNNGWKNAQKWYEQQGRKTRFTLLEYRKDKEGQFKHEFVVARLDSTTLCRFDRRARDGERGYALHDEGAAAEDSAHILSSFETEYQELLKHTEVLLSIKLPRGEDLGLILAVCEGIQTHAKASAYSLMQYNCYFFSWMIVAAVARRTYNWETVVLSKEDWDDIIRNSLTETFTCTPFALTRPPLIGRKKSAQDLIQWNHTGSRTRTTNSIESLATFQVGFFRKALISQYSDYHGTVERVLRKLLLRSQLGPAIIKELGRVETHSLFLAKYVVATRGALATLNPSAEAFCPLQYNRRYGVIFGEDYIPDDNIMNDYINLLQDSLPDSLGWQLPRPKHQPELKGRWRLSQCYQRSQLFQASIAAAKVLSVERDLAKTPTDESCSWQDAWETTWFRSRREMRFYHDYRIFVNQMRERKQKLTKMLDSHTSEDHQNSRLREESSSQRPSQLGTMPAFVKSPEGMEWDDIGHRVMKEWKNTWDKCDLLCSQYAEKTTTTVMGIIMERLGDVAPEQLVYGDITKETITTQPQQREESHLLQAFIRHRMEEHFEMVDRFGFGSFGELITSAEEAMCEIWVTSLDVIELNRYQPRYTTMGHTMARC